MSDRPENDLSQALKSLEILLSKHDSPPPDPVLSGIEGYEAVYEYIRGLKDALYHFSIGEFKFKSPLKGATIGYAKTIQSNIRHLAWQCKSVASGDLSQKVDFMGDLSEAFNSMTEGLKRQQTVLSEKQKELTALAAELQLEISKKESIEAALRASEETYRQRALHDPLTGLYNRGYFFESASKEMEKLRRQQRSSCCVMMMDIDRFKDFNDTFGHLAGDQAIRIVASTVESVLRRTDIFARYGGEEFVLLLANTSLERGAMVAERIRVAVSSHPGPRPEGRPITLSMGLTSVEGRRLEHQTPAEEILHQALAEADAALYTAKQKGRNMVWRYRREGAEQQIAVGDLPPSFRLRENDR